MTRREHFLTILILGSLSTISPLSIDMYLPGFPAIAKDLDTNISQVQLSLTAYLVGIAAGQLLYGPLLDRFGRRPPVYVGLFIYTLASVGCALTTSAHALITMRFLQAIGGCAGMVAAQALIRDLFPVNKTAQAFSSITLVIAVSPMIAPTVGGYVTVALGWHYIFYILAALSVIILALIYFVLPAGRVADASISLRPQAVLGNFYTVVKEPQFFIYTLAGGLAMSAPFAYIAGSPDVFINIYHVSEEQYGWIFAFIACAIIGSTQLNHIILKRFKSEEVIYATLIYQTIVGSILVTGTYLGWYNQYGLIIMIFLFLIGQGVVGPNASALSLAPFSKYAGSAAALLGSFRMAIGGIVTSLVSVFHNNTAMPMVSIMVMSVVTGFIILLTSKRVVRYQADKKKAEEDTIVL